MRKETKAIKGTERDEFKHTVHHLWDSADDEMEAKELKQFVNEDNTPNLRRLNESDDSIGVEECIIIGTYLVLNHLHTELHRTEVETIEIDVKAMLAGEKSLREIVPASMPKELVDLLERLVGDDGKKGKRGKK